MTDEEYMRLALSEAQRAARRDEVPVGAVLVASGKVIARAHNLRERRQDATAHAELICIRKACKKLKSWRLDGAVLYVTLEPCPMCAGAIVNARIDRVCFGAYEPKGGACGSKCNVLAENGLNHRTSCSGGILEGECAAAITEYFKGKRKNKQK